jgi:hypothetical protein
MSAFNHPNFLRSVLLIDAATCVATGGLMTIAASPLAALTQIPDALLFNAGLSLVPVAAFMVLVATRRTIRAAGVWLVIVGNIAWVTGSIWLLASGAISPNMLGAAFTAVQAAAVALLAVLEAAGLRRRPIAVA